MINSPKQTLARFLIRLRVSANFLTCFGLFMAFASAYFIWMGDLFLAGWALLFSGLLDLLDGAVARESKKVSAFGGIFDSSLDRYGDGAVMGMLVIYFARAEDFLFSFLALLALIGAFSVSYIRARAECEVESCRAGFWERGERVVYLVIGFLLQCPEPVIAVLALGTQWTALQRLLVARQASRPGEKNLNPLKSASRNNISYYLKISLLILFVFLWKFLVPLP